MNNVGENIQFKEITKKSRTLDLDQLMKVLKSNISVFWSWGSRAYIVDYIVDPRMFRMMVSGHHHKGHVYIFLNGDDLFEVYLTTSKGKIKDKTDQGLYFDMLVDWIDRKVERVSEYQY